ncbi:hypothetical protein KVE50_00400 [Helicobacter pylori]|nr:hypothetical protein KVE50_00400 [Helicobacter pylori]
MILENACEYKEYLPSVFDELGFNGSFEVVDNNIHLNLTPRDNQETPTKEQVLEKLKELTLKAKKQELEAKIKTRQAWMKRKITKDLEAKEIKEILGDKLTEKNMDLFLDTKKEEVKEVLKQSLDHLNLDPIVLEAITETTSDELLLKAMNTAYIKKQILFCAVVARGELIKMIKRASLTNNEKDSANIIIAAEKVSKLFIDAGVSLFGKEQIQVVESHQNTNLAQMNMSDLLALANSSISEADSVE